MDNHIALPVNQHQKTVQIHSLVDHVDELRVEEHGADVEQMWDHGETCCLHQSPVHQACTLSVSSVSPIQKHGIRFVETLEISALTRFV